MNSTSQADSICLCPTYVSYRPLTIVITCMLCQGCSAGVISVELVKNILAAKPNSTALVVSTENLTQNLYMGNERGFLLQNTLFRCGEWPQYLL